MRIRSLDYEEIVKALDEGFGVSTGNYLSINFLEKNSVLCLINLF